METKRLKMISHKNAVKTTIGKLMSLWLLATPLFPLIIRKWQYKDSGIIETGPINWGYSLFKSDGYGSIYFSRLMRLAIIIFLIIVFIGLIINMVSMFKENKKLHTICSAFVIAQFIGMLFYMVMGIVEVFKDKGFIIDSITISRYTLGYIPFIIGGFICVAYFLLPRLSEKHRYAVDHIIIKSAKKSIIGDLMSYLLLLTLLFPLINIRVYGITRMTISGYSGVSIFIKNGHFLGGADLFFDLAAAVALLLMTAAVTGIIFSSTAMLISKKKMKRTFSILIVLQLFCIIIYTVIGIIAYSGIKKSIYSSGVSVASFGFIPCIIGVFILIAYFKLPRTTEQKSEPTDNEIADRSSALPSDTQ